MSIFALTTNKLRLTARLIILSIIAGILVSGCDTVTVVRALNPGLASVKLPASSVALSFSISQLPSHGKFDSKAVSESFQGRLTKELTKELALHGFTIRQSPDGVDFSMNVILTDMTVEPLVFEKYGQVFHQEPAVYFVTWDISYVGPRGIPFGTIRRTIGKGQVSYMTNVTFSDGTQGVVRVYGPTGLNDTDISQAAKDIASFTQKALQEPKNKQ